MVPEEHPKYESFMKRVESLRASLAKFADDSGRGLSFRNLGHRRGGLNFENAADAIKRAVNQSFPMDVDHDLKIAEAELKKGQRMFDKANKSASEDALRRGLIRLAHSNPDLRGDILPLLEKQAARLPQLSDDEKKKALEAINILLKKIDAPVKWTNINENSVDVPIPKGLSSIFATLSIKIEWWADGKGGYGGTLGWEYDHPSGGSNGKNIGRVGFDPHEGKWGWSNDSKPGREFGYVD